MLKGRIIKNISDAYTVIANHCLYECKARGKFRNEKITPLVGDIVTIDEENNYILSIEERRNELQRPNVSNIDIALIVVSLKKPDLSLNLLDKEIVSIKLSKVEPIICFTKLDLASKEEIKEMKFLQKYYEKLNIKVFYNTKLTKLVRYLKGKTVVLTGQTGAGKSSLLNKLDKNLSLKVGEISEALGRGKHTTRHTEIHEVKNIYFVDTPGFSSLDLKDFTNEEIRDTFLEFAYYPCEFNDCMHSNEQNCHVKKAVSEGKILASRYQNYTSFINRGEK